MSKMNLMGGKYQRQIQRINQILKFKRKWRKINPCTTKPSTLKSLSKQLRTKRVRAVTHEPGAEDDGGASPARHHGAHADAAQAAQAELEHVPTVWSPS